MRYFKLPACVIGGLARPSDYIKAASGEFIPIGASIGLWFQFKADWMTGAAILLDEDGVTEIAYSEQTMAGLLADARN